MISVEREMVDVEKSRRDLQRLGGHGGEEIPTEPNDVCSAVCDNRCYRIDPISRQ